MIVGFKGDSNRLKTLFKNLGLKEVKPITFEELESVIKENKGDVVVSNYNEIMVFNNPTADLMEKRNNVLKVVEKSKHNVYLVFNKEDPSIDRLPLDVAVCTKVDTEDMALIEEIFNFVNTDLPYNGKLSDDGYAVKLKGDFRATEKKLSDLIKLFK